MSIDCVTGDLFGMRADLIVQGVNTAGVMGAGIAKQARALYGEGMFAAYRETCRRGVLVPGGWQRHPHPRLPSLVNLASQDLPGPHARIEWIEAGLDSLMHDSPRSTIAVPWIGAGIGGLSRLEVARSLRRLVKVHPEINLIVVTHTADEPLTDNESATLTGWSGLTSHRERMTTATATTVRVDLRIENIYPDGTIVTALTAAVPAPADRTDDALQDWAGDHLFDFTGTGRTDGDSAYVVTVVDSDDAELTGRVFEFGF